MTDEDIRKSKSIWRPSHLKQGHHFPRAKCHHFFPHAPDHIMFFVSRYHGKLALTHSHWRMWIKDPNGCNKEKSDRNLSQRHHKENTICFIKFSRQHYEQLVLFRSFRSSSVSCQRRAGIMSVTTAVTHITASTCLGRRSTTPQNGPQWTPKKPHVAQKSMNDVLLVSSHLLYCFIFTTTAWWNINFEFFYHRTQRAPQSRSQNRLCSRMSTISNHKQVETWIIFLRNERSNKINTDPGSTLELPGELYAPSQL